MTAPTTACAYATESLREHYRGSLELGVALEPEHLVEQGDTVQRHFRRLTAENAMKWGRLCPHQGQYVWEQADAIARFARRHEMRMTGHTLLWHQMQPPWLFVDGDSVVSKTELAERLRAHIFRMVERYADVVDNWDVVNEAIGERPDEFWRGASENSKWYEIFGNEGFVELAFQYAADAVNRFCPDARLYYNDYNIERADKRHKVIEMVRQLRGRGVRIDGVGIQGHVDLNWPTTEELGCAIDEFYEQDLLVKVSELDVSMYPQDELHTKVFHPAVEPSPELEATLAQRYADLFQVFVERAKKLTSVVFWGLSDDHSWLNHFPTWRPNYPLLINREHQPKLAMQRLLQLPV